ncbi:MAG: glycosyltransferase family 4 protein [Acidimicrobiales bacterium]|nr:glycosyltransferase family 4 protein [Acidimicrobiales bacterium]
MDPLSVAIDATPLLGPRTGIGVAVAGMVQELAGRPEVTLSGYGLTLRRAGELPSVLPPEVRARTRPMPAGALVWLWGRADRPRGEWWTGPAAVVHGTNFVVPPMRRARTIVSVWDLTAVLYPELVSPTSRHYPAAVSRAVARGAWVHTGARYVADEIASHFGVPPARIRVVPPGIELPSPGSGGDRSGPPYILGLGTTEPRKDFPGLVRAFDRLAARHPDLELRIAGPKGWGEDDLEAAVAGAAHRSRIHRLGWVHDAGRLIAGAAVFAYPSVYEGFGFPPLEAMARGVPVVATATGAVPEVVGEAAELVPPGDPDALAAAIAGVLDDATRRDRLIAAGRDRAAHFSSRRCGDQLVGLYRDLAASV